MIHLAPVGLQYEGPGLSGPALAVLRSPVATLCGVRVTDESVRVMMPHDDPLSCRSCLRLLPTRTSTVVPVLLPEVAS